MQPHRYNLEFNSSKDGLASMYPRVWQVTCLFQSPSRFWLVVSMREFTHQQPASNPRNTNRICELAANVLDKRVSNLSQIANMSSCGPSTKSQRPRASSFKLTILPTSFQ